MPMTYEDEEFNRIEMESRIRQESVRATRDAKAAHYGGRPMTLRECMEAEETSQPEQEPVAFETWHKTNYVQPLEKYGDTYKNSHVRCRHEGWLGAKSTPTQRTWVELPDQELVDIRKRVQEYTPIDSVKYGEAIQRAMNSALKEKNT